jgi:hypothetical protein
MSVEIRTRDVGGDRAGDHREGRQVAVVDEVVLGEPDEVETELVGERNLLQYLRVQLGIRNAGARWIAEVVCNAEAECVCHRCLPHFIVPQWV